MGTHSGRQFSSGLFHRNKQLGLRGITMLLVWGTLASSPGLAAEGAVPQLSGFIARKEKQARALAKELDLKVSEDVWAYFQTARTGNVVAITNAFERLKKRSSQYEGSKDDPTVGSPVWQTLIEVEVAIEAFVDGESKYSTAFGQGVVDALPAGSIYFGGTDAGRGLITALCKSHEDADPFYTITQNALADGRYLVYLRSMYGSKIRIPTDADSQQAFETYLKDAQQRLLKKKLKPGEDVRISEGRVTVSGEVAVMAINGLIAKTLFEANPDQEFYIEQSYPLDWMYPHLSPHQFIFKVNRKPLPELSEEEMQKDRKFWTQQQKLLIGDWLKVDTSVADVCTFARQVFTQTNLAGFTGDPRFVQNDYAAKLYSKLRSSSADLYHWRARNSRAAAERDRMKAEADFAYRQAFAYCPRSPEALFGYVELLKADERLNDAHRLALTAQSLDVANNRIADLVAELGELKRAAAK